MSGIVATYFREYRVLAALKLYNKFGEMSIAVILQTINSIFWDRFILY